MNYKHIKFLGQGTFGSVDKAMSPTGEYVAIKKYREGCQISGIGPEIIREINTMLTLAHPHIAQIRDVRVLGNGDMEIIMDYGGETLNDYVYGQTDLRRNAMTRKIFIHVLSAVSFMHRAGVMHRDIKPQNILIKNDKAILCDFGLAKRTVPFRKRPHTYSVSTVNYKPPELLGDREQDYNNKIDLWSIGCVMYEFLNKKVLFPGNTKLSVIASMIKTLGPTSMELESCGLLYANNRTTCYESRNNVFEGEYGAVIKKLLSLHPHERPSAQDVLVELDKKGKYSNANNTCVYEYNKKRFSSDMYVRKSEGVRMSRDSRDTCVAIMEENCHEEKQTFLIAVNIFDMYAAACTSALVKKNKEIISHCCSLIASKFVDLRPMRVSELALSCSVSESDIVQWERNILKALHFRIDGPTLLDIYKTEFGGSLNEDLTSEHWSSICNWIRDYDFMTNKTAQELRDCMIAKFPQ
jgi:hypothetical protein